jgi:3-dehydroquinate dehydratase/shikimate dehydrogenase
MENLVTSRLNLRPWKEEDQEVFFALNSDPQVMEFMPKTLSREESNNLLIRLNNHFQEYGFGLLAAELTNSNTFIGFIGLAIPRFQASFTPCVEIGWRLGTKYWGQGYATEGGKALLIFAFTQLKLREIVSYTAVQNVRSRHVMERIGMTFIETFEHPELPTNHWLKKHLLYKKTNNFIERISNVNKKKIETRLPRASTY